MKEIDLREIRARETEGSCGELVEETEMTQEEWARLRRRVREELPKKAARRSIRKIPLIAAALVCVFAIAACSAEVFHWNGGLSRILNLEDTERVYAEKTGLAQNLKESVDTDAGTTVSIRQALAANGICYLLFDVELPEEQAYFAEGAPIVENMQFSGLDDLSALYPLSDRQDAGENGHLSMYAVGHYEENDAEEIPIKLSLQNLTYRTISQSVNVTGMWNLKCTVKGNSAKLEGETELQGTLCDRDTQKNTPITITGYCLTPLEARIEFYRENGDIGILDDVDVPEDVGILEKDGILCPDWSLTIQYKNGDTEEINCVTREDLNLYQDDEDEQGNHRITCRICLDRIVEIEEVQSIVFCGTQIDVK